MRLGARGEVSTPGAVTASAVTDEVLPAGEATVTVETEAWPLVLLSGQVHVTGFAAGQDAVDAPGPVSSGFQVLAVSWTGIVLLAVVAGVVVWLVIRRRRARGSRPQVVSANPTPAP